MADQSQNGGPQPANGGEGASGSEGGPRMVVKEQVADEVPCFFRFVTAVTRTWGFLTLVGLWYCTVELIKDRDNYVYIQWYTLALSIVVTFFELAWICTKICRCKDDGGCCCTCWRIILWVDNWRKTILYLGLSIPEFTIKPFSVYALVSGILLIVLGVFYFLKSLKDSQCIKQKKVKSRSYHEDPSARLVDNEGAPRPEEQYHAVRDESTPTVNKKPPPPKATNPFDD